MLKACQAALVAAHFAHERLKTGPIVEVGLHVVDAARMVAAAAAMLTSSARNNCDGAAMGGDCHGLDHGTMKRESE